MEAERLCRGLKLANAVGWWFDCVDSCQRLVVGKGGLGYLRSRYQRANSELDSVSLKIILWSLEFLIDVRRRSLSATKIRSRSRRVSYSEEDFPVAGWLSCSKRECVTRAMPSINPKYSRHDRPFRPNHNNSVIIDINKHAISD